MFSNEYSLIYLLKVIYRDILHHLDAVLKEAHLFDKIREGCIKCKWVFLHTWNLFSEVDLYQYDHNCDELPTLISVLAESNMIRKQTPWTKIQDAQV